jgi:diguanylate cyclase (GGDEF)-like protein
MRHKEIFDGLKDWYLNRPINFKIQLLTVCLFSVAQCLIFGLTLSYEYWAVRSSAVQDAVIQSNIVRDNVSAAVAFKDREAATEILSSLSSAKYVREASVRFRDGSVIALYQGQNSNGLALSSDVRREGVDYFNGYIRVVKSIYFGGNMVGTLVIYSGSEPVTYRIFTFFVVSLFSSLVGVVFALFAGSRMTLTITKPLTSLMSRANNVIVSKDYSPVSTAGVYKDEVGQLSVAVEDMINSMRLHNLKLTNVAYHDKITGLPNRHYFNERLQQTLSLSARNNSRCCVLFIDLDRFKYVNDTFGHDVGDELLCMVAASLISDSRSSDFVSRIGGDEFAIIVENVNGYDGPSLLAEKIIFSLSQEMVVMNNSVQIGASIGIAFAPDHAVDAAELLRSADTAMYSAKKGGRNGFRVYDASLS